MSQTDDSWHQQTENVPLSRLDSVSTCQYVLPELVGYRDLGTSWSTSRTRRCTETYRR